MRIHSLFLFTILLGIGVGTNRTFAQSVISQWNFNSSLTSPSFGTGSVYLLGGVTADFIGASGSTDPSAPNFALFLESFPNQGNSSGSVGAQFQVDTSSATANNLLFSFDLKNSLTASRWYQLQYTTDGTNYMDLGNPMENSSNGTGFLNKNVMSFAGIPGASSANFGVRVVSVFEPGTNNYQSIGNSSTYGSDGNVRFDMVTVSQANRWTASSGNLQDGANWTSGAPVSGQLSSAVVLDENGFGLSMVNNTTSGFNLLSISFTGATTTYILSGSSITLGNSGPTSGLQGLTTLINGTSISQFIATDLVIHSRQTWDTGDAGGSLTILGNVSGNGGIRVRGSSSLTLQGANTYSGGTSVESGTLMVTNTSGSATGTGNVTIQNGATLAGSGMIAPSSGNSVVLNAGAILNPGLNVTDTTSLKVNGDVQFEGGLGIGPLSFGVSSIWRIDVTSSGSSDLLDLSGGTGSLTFLTSTSDTILLDINAIDTVGEFSTKVYTIATKSNSGSFNGFDPSHFTFQSNIDHVLSYNLGISGNNLQLTIVTVPEPASILLISALILGGIHIWRCRKSTESNIPLAI